jgi:hypothetical protein
LAKRDGRGEVQPTTLLVIRSGILPRRSSESESGGARVFRHTTSVRSWHTPDLAATEHWAAVKGQTVVQAVDNHKARWTHGRDGELFKTFEPSVFVWSTVMSRPRTARSSMPA